MHKVALLGGGKVGGVIARLLSGSGDYAVAVADADPAALRRVEAEGEAGGGAGTISTREVRADDPDGLAGLLGDCDSVISACSFDVNLGIATAALDAGVDYYDLTEDVATTRGIKALARRARPGQIFVPQCGLAPGFVSIVGQALADRFDTLDSLHLRVGALPLFPSNQMRYNLTWSTDGLINEYGNACEAIYGGKRIEVLPLEGLEHFSLDGVDYEAFNTSGGVGTLCDTLGHRVQCLDYKTIRYPGHRDLMAFLMNGLRLNHRRALLKEILEGAVPMTPQDAVLVFCTGSGTIDGRLTQITDARKVYHGTFRGVAGSAIQLTTAAALCAVLDLRVTGELPVERGLVRQEQVELPSFLDNRFGRVYEQVQRGSYDAWPVTEPTPPLKPATPPGAASRSVTLSGV